VLIFFGWRLASTRGCHHICAPPHGRQVCVAITMVATNLPGSPTVAANLYGSVWCLLDLSSGHYDGLYTHMAACQPGLYPSQTGGGNCHPWRPAFNKANFFFLSFIFEKHLPIYQNEFYFVDPT